MTTAEVQPDEAGAGVSAPLRNRSATLVVHSAAALRLLLPRNPRRAILRSQRTRNPGDVGLSVEAP